MKAQVGSELVLFSHSMCPFAQRALIGLNLAEKPFNVVQIDLYGHKPAWFIEMNPKGQVPVLKHDNHIITESEDILDYISSSIKQNIAASIEERLWWRGKVNGQLTKAGKETVYTGRVDSKLSSILYDMNNRISQNGGAFLAGDRVSRVDASAFPFVYRLNQEFGLEGCEKLSDWLSLVSSIEAFRTSVAQPWWWWW